MKKKTVFIFIAIAAAAAVFVVSRGVGRSVTKPAVSSGASALSMLQPVKPEPPKPVAPPTAEELKIWARRQGLLAEIKMPDPKETEKLSDEERLAKMREYQEERKKQEDEIFLQLHQSFPSVQAGDIPLTLQRIQAFIAVITPRYYKLQEEEVFRLQTAGAFSEAGLPLIRIQATQNLGKEYPTLGEEGIKQLLGVKD